MKKFKFFLKKHSVKIMLILAGLIVFFIPKLRAFFSPKDSKKVVNKDGTKPIDKDFEKLSDIDKEASILADAIYNILHLENVPILSVDYLYAKETYDINSPNFKAPNYHDVITIMVNNKSIIGDIQEHFFLKYKKDFLICFPYFNNQSALDILLAAFPDVTNFTPKTPPTYTTEKKFGVHFPKPKVYDLSKYKNLSLYYSDFYNQFKGINLKHNTYKPY